MVQGHQVCNAVVGSGMLTLDHETVENGAQLLCFVMA